MRETALLMIQDPTVMGVDIQNAHPSEAVEAFVLYLQSHVINPLVARVGQNDPVSVAYESFMEALDNGDLGVLSQLTNELLRTIAATGITVPVVAIAVQKDLTGSPGSSYELYDEAQDILRIPTPVEPERFEYNGSCSDWYTVVSTDPKDGRRHVGEFTGEDAFEEATAYVIKVEARILGMKHVIAPGRYDEEYDAAAEWNSERLLWFTIE